MSYCGVSGWNIKKELFGIIGKSPRFKTSNYAFNKNYLSLRIKTIEDYHYTGKVHNFSVEHDNSYSSLACSLHNCKCITFKNALIGVSLFKSCCDETLSMTQKGVFGKKYVIFVDSATSDAPTADYCAITVWEDDAQNNRFILRHLFHEKGYPITDPTGGIDDQAHKLHHLWKDFNKALVIVEKNNAGIALIQAATALGVPDIIEHYTHSPSTGKPTQKAGKAEDVINYIEGLKAGIVVFPSNPDDIYTLESLEKVKNEHLNFGVKKGKSGEKYEAIAGHDDIFDSCFGAWKFRGDLVDTLPKALTLNGGYDGYSS